MATKRFRLFGSLLLSLVFFTTYSSAGEPQLPHATLQPIVTPSLSDREERALVLDDFLLCDLEMLLCKGFEPLGGFLCKNDYDSVVERCRLADGTLWPMPIVLPVEASFASQLKVGSRLHLKDKQKRAVATLSVEELYKPDLQKECLNVCGTLDTQHPHVARVLGNPDVWYVGGAVQGVNTSLHYDFTQLRLTPEEAKRRFKERGWKKVVAFQTRNPLHRAHVALISHAYEQVSHAGDAGLLLHPVVGVTQKGDIDYVTRVRCYQRLWEYLPRDRVELSLLPLAMRMTGPREALWHALIRKNYGCTHFIVGRDHAGPSSKTQEGKSFYHPYAAQQFLEQYKDELGIIPMPSSEFVFVEGKEVYQPLIAVKEGEKIGRISGSELRQKLQKNGPLPEWFSYPEVLQELKSYYAKKQGVCIYLIGLSGAGKTTIAAALQQKLRERDPLGRPVLILDGDEVRNSLCPDLGFSKRDRSMNVRRIGYVASQIVQCGGVAICSNIAPFEEDRLANRKLIERDGLYLECYINTPLATCEKRDVKGLYQRARRGEIAEFTGISSPFEEPQCAEITLSGDGDIGEILEKVLSALEKRGMNL